MKYSNAPLKNVVCEFRPVQKPEGWSDVFIGQIYDRLKDKYSDKEDVVSLFRFDFSEDISLDKKKETKLKSEAGNEIFISQQRLAFNLNQKYPGWDHLKPEVLRIWNEYKNITNVDKLQLLTVRYFNEIKIPFGPEGKMEETDYFTLCTNYDHINKYCIRLEQNITFKCDEKQYLSLSLVSVTQTVQEVTFIFQLVYSVTDCEDLSEDNMANLLENAHTCIEDAFEKTVTQKLKEEVFKK